MPEAGFPHDKLFDATPCQVGFDPSAGGFDFREFRHGAVRKLGKH